MKNRLRTLVRTSLLAVPIVLLSGSLILAGETTIKKDPYRDNSYNVYDNYGAKTGRVTKDPYRDNSYKVYDRYGHQEGTIEKSPYNDDIKIKDN